jgi:hypothetical protein
MEAGDRPARERERSDEWTPSRVLEGLVRRVRHVPHNLAWQLSAGRANRGRLEGLHNVYAGGRCVVMGNGPSINRTDLALLGNQFTFATNRFYLKKAGFVPTFYVAINGLVIEQCAPEIARLPMMRFIDWDSRRHFDDLTNTQNIAYLLLSFRQKFSTDLQEGIWGGASVTYATLQVAYYLGFRHVILVGVDHRYQVKGRPHKVVVSRGPDPNHFASSYFGAGFRWQLPDLRTSEYAYALAKTAFEEAGGEIIDCTVGGELRVFQKADLADALG